MTDNTARSRIYDNAVRLLQSGNAKGAATLFKTAFAKSPDLAVNALEEGYQQITDGNIAEGARLLAAAVPYAENHAAEVYQIGKDMLERGQSHGLRVVDAAVQMMPDLSREAESMVASAVQRNQQLAQDIYIDATALYEQKSFEPAMRFFKLAYDADPTNVTTAFGLAITAAKLHTQYGAAFRMLTQRIFEHAQREQGDGIILPDLEEMARNHSDLPFEIGLQYEKFAHEHSALKGKILDLERDMTAALSDLESLLKPEGSLLDTLKRA